MTGYTRQSVANISDGLTIFADDINNEFNAIQTAFNGTTGHVHDGSIGSGPKISLTTSVSGILPAANGGTGGINNFSATTDPTINEDSDDGYVVGSRWINTVSDKHFVCVDSTVGAAIWQRYQLYSVDLAAIAALTSAANKIPYATGAGTWALTDFSAYGRTLIDDADAATARTTLGLVIGTDVQAYDTELTALAGTTSAANKLPYYTGAGTASTTDFTPFARTLVDDADASTALSTLGVSAYVKTFLDDADAATARSTLGVDAAGINQPLDATLTALAAFNTNGFLVQTAANTFAGRTLTGTANEITVTNGAGTAGNPVFSLPAALTFTGKTITGGTFNSGAFNGSLGATTPSTVSATTITASSIITANQNFQSSTAVTVIGTTGAGNVYLRPNGVGSAAGEFRVDSGGGANVSGNIVAAGAAFARGQVFEGGPGAVILQPQTAGAVYFRANPNSGTGQVYTDTSGNLVASGDVYGFSDRKLKKDISPLNDVSQAIDNIQPVSFEKIDTGQKSIGFIAQDVQEYFPELITEDQDGTLALSYANLTAILWQEIKSLRQRVAELEAK